MDRPLPRRSRVRLSKRRESIASHFFRFFFACSAAIFLSTVSFGTVMRWRMALSNSGNASNSWRDLLTLGTTAFFVTT